MFTRIVKNFVKIQDSAAWHYGMCHILGVAI